MLSYYCAEAYRLGQEAYPSGLNPYTLGTEEYYQWNDGFNNSQTAFEEDLEYV